MATVSPTAYRANATKRRVAWQRRIRRARAESILSLVKRGNARAESVFLALVGGKSLLRRGISARLFCEKVAPYRGIMEKSSKKRVGMALSLASKLGALRGGKPLRFPCAWRKKMRPVARVTPRKNEKSTPIGVLRSLRCVDKKDAPSFFITFYKFRYHYNDTQYNL